MQNLNLDPTDKAQVYKDADYEAWEDRAFDWLSEMAPILDPLFFKVKKAPTIASYSEDHLLAREWYRDAIPLLGSLAFTRFATSQVGIFRSIYTGPRVIKISFVPANQLSSAAIDISGGRVFLSQGVFDLGGYMTAGLLGDMEAAILSVISGLICHEAMHFQKSPDNIIVMIRDGVSLAGGFGFTSSLFSGSMGESSPSLLDQMLISIGQIVEDFYIEDIFRSSKSMAPQMQLFVSTGHQYYFNFPETIRRIAMCFSNVSPHPKKARQVQIDMPNVIDVFAAFKNWTYADNDIVFGKFFRKYIRMFGKARGLRSSKERGALAIKIFKTMLDDDNIYFDKEKAQNQAESHRFVTGEAERIYCEPETVAEILKKISIGEVSGEMEEALDDLREGLIILEAGFKGKLSELHEKELKRAGRSQVDKIRPTIVVEEEERSGPDTILRDKRFVNFGNRLKKILGRGKGPTEMKTSGQLLVEDELYRIKIDSKVFSDPAQRALLARDYEIVVLMDFSGSMAGNKLLETISVGLSSWESLTLAGCKAWLLGHTTREKGGYEHPAVYVFGTPDMPISHPARKLQAWYKSTSKCYNNVDGFAIEKSVNISFSTQPGRKLMIVISDGQPYGENYSGEAAIMHTQSIVKKIRRSGIEVASITIETGAYEANDTIYGGKKNVKSEDPSVLLKLLQALFEA